MDKPERYSKEWVREVFTYHPPDEEQIKSFEAVRESCIDLANTIIAHCPNCADRTAAIRLLTQTRMTANASIALKGLV